MSVNCSPQITGASPSRTTCSHPIVNRKDEVKHGEYRTKRVILAVCDAMQRAIETGEPCRTRLDPPPADPRVAYAAREDANDWRAL